MKFVIKEIVINKFFINLFVNIIRGKKQIYILISIFALISCTHSRNNTVTQYDNSSKNEKGAHLIEQITEQDILIEVTQTDKSEKVRMAAVERITEQDILIEITHTDKSEKVRMAAVERITDQDFLIEVAQTNKSEKIRMSAVERITDQDFLIKVAQADSAGKVRMAAVERITDQDFLIKVVKTDRSVNVRMAAVERIKNQDFLIKVAQTDHSYIIQLAAARTIQYLLDRNQYTDYKNIKENIAKLMLFLLDPPIIERHGLLKLDVQTEVVPKSYDPSGRLIGSASNYIIKIKALSGETILKRKFIAPPPANSEMTEHRDATINYDGIMTLLWFLASSE